MNALQQSIKRMTIEGTMEEREEARVFCQESGYRIMQDTPQIISESRIDPRRFRIVAEKSGSE